MCIIEMNIIGSDNGMISIEPLGINFSDILTEINEFSINRNECIFTRENAFENVVCQMTSFSYRP